LHHFILPGSHTRLRSSVSVNSGLDVLKTMDTYHTHVPPCQFRTPVLQYACFILLGRELEKRIGKDLFLYVYFIAGIVAALGYSITSTAGYPIVGASGAIMGVFAALTVLAPEMEVYVYFIPMKIKYALVLFVLLDFMLLNANDMVAHTAHLSGVLVGIYMGYRIKKTIVQRSRNYNGFRR